LDTMKPSARTGSDPRLAIGLKALLGIKRRHHSTAAPRIEGDYWLPPPIIRTTPIRKTRVDPDHWDGDGSNHQ
jgi:hypothetical protein